MAVHAHGPDHPLRLLLASGRTLLFVSTLHFSASGQWIPVGSPQATPEPGKTLLAVEVSPGPSWPSWKAAQSCSLLRGLLLCFYVLPLVIVFVALCFSLSLLVSPLNMWLPCVTYETGWGKGVLN